MPNDVLKPVEVRDVRRLQEHGGGTEGAVDPRRLPHDGGVSDETAGDGQLPAELLRHGVARSADRRKSSGLQPTRL